MVKLNEFHADETAAAAASAEALKDLGGGELGYIRPITGRQVAEMIPEAQDLPPNANLWALLNADGTPIMISDNRAVLIANATENNLVTASWH